jgi:TPR repeat protein
MRREIATVLISLLPALTHADAFDDARAAIGAEDYDAAIALLVPLAEDGHPNAQYQLGALYAAGRGVAQDDAAALRWFRGAAEQGFAPAQFNLAAMYYEGRGVAQDHVRAAMWNAVAIANASPEYVAAYEQFHDALQALMSTEQSAEAMSLARRCIDADFKGCD